MKEFTQTSSKKVWLIFILTFVALTFFKIGYGLGFALGVITSVVNLKLLIYQIDQMMFFKKFNAWIGIPFYIFKSFIYVLPMIASLLWPEWFNLYTVVGGLLSPKFLFYFNELLLKKETHD